MFANGPEDLGSIPGRVIPKTQKMVLDASLLNTQHYKVRIKGKVEQFREGVAPSPTPWCSSYRKGSLRVTLDYGRQLYFYLLVSVSETLFHCRYFNWISDAKLLIAISFSSEINVFMTLFFVWSFSLTLFRIWYFSLILFRIWAFMFTLFRI